MTVVAECSRKKCFRPPAITRRCAQRPMAARRSDAPRYSDAAGVENHPQITDFVPRRYRTIALLRADRRGD